MVVVIDKDGKEHEFDSELFLFDSNIPVLHIIGDSPIVQLGPDGQPLPTTRKPLASFSVANIIGVLYRHASARVVR